MSIMPNTREAIRRNAFHIWVLMGCAVYGLSSSFTHILEDSRRWRDLTGQTPFHDVRILSVTATEIELTITGTLRKTRSLCETVSDPITQVVYDGISYPAEFRSDEPPPMPISRVGAKEPQAFGPWIITSPFPYPDRARMYRTHDCPDGRQTNLVFDVTWPKPDGVSND